MASICMKMERGAHVWKGTLTEDTFCVVERLVGLIGIMCLSQRFAPFMSCFFPVDVLTGYEIFALIHNFVDVIEYFNNLLHTSPFVFSLI